MTQQSPSLPALLMYLHGGMPHLNHETDLAITDVARNDLIMAKLLHPFWLELAGKTSSPCRKILAAAASSVGVVNSACMSGCVECMECVDYHAQCVEVGRGLPSDTCTLHVQPGTPFRRHTANTNTP